MAVITLPKAANFNNGGLWGNSSPVVKSSWSDPGEFELDRTKSKNNIAENLFVLGHETHNTFQQYLLSFTEPTQLLEKK